jgi:hypothetical protein
VGAGAVEVLSPCSYPSAAIMAEIFLPDGPLPESPPKLPVVEVDCKCIASLLVQLLLFQVYCRDEFASEIVVAVQENRK